MLHILMCSGGLQTKWGPWLKPLTATLPVKQREINKIKLSVTKSKEVSSRIDLNNEKQCKCLHACNNWLLEKWGRSESSSSLWHVFIFHHTCRCIRTQPSLIFWCNKYKSSQMLSGKMCFHANLPRSVQKIRLNEMAANNLPVLARAALVRWVPASREDGAHHDSHHLCTCSRLVHASKKRGTVTVWRGFCSVPVAPLTMPECLNLVWFSKWTALLLHYFYFNSFGASQEVYDRLFSSLPLTKSFRVCRVVPPNGLLFQKCWGSNSEAWATACPQIHFVVVRPRVKHSAQLTSLSKQNIGRSFTC